MEWPLFFGMVFIVIRICAQIMRRDLEAPERCVRCGADALSVLDRADGVDVGIEPVAGLQCVACGAVQPWVWRRPDAR